MKNKTFIDSVRCAICGILKAIETEKNYKYYTIIYIVTLLFNIGFKLNFGVYIAQLVTACGVFSAECLNTSIERLTDLEEKEIKPEVRVIKDIAASGVLCWGIGYFACELIYLLKEFI